VKSVCYICSKDGHRTDNCPAKDTGKILAHRRLIKPLLTLDDLDAGQVYSLSNKAPEISEEMLRVPDYYDDMDILTDENDDENDENDFNVQGSSTKKRNLYEEDDDEDSISDN
jgi:hypothetical protein